MEKKITRKDFLRLSGSLLAGGAIAGASGHLLWKMFKRPDELFYPIEEDTYVISDGDVSVSPYRLEATIPSPGILAMELDGGRLLAALPGKMRISDLRGGLIQEFPTGPDARDIAVWKDEYYVLYPFRIEVYGPDGSLRRSWNACSESSDYCFFTVMDQGVYVTDAGDKNICRYRLDGPLAGFIESPRGFVVPSYSFAIANRDGLVYCSNPGRHQVECYSPEGKFLKSFGQAGVEPGHFSGCCNPVHICVSPAGELLTSEKGIPRISCWSPDGQFRSILLNRKALGGGSDAREVRMTWDGRLVVAGKGAVSIYRYDPALARAEGSELSAACRLCGLDCPVKRGISI